MYIYWGGGKGIQEKDVCVMGWGTRNPGKGYMCIGLGEETMK